MRSSMRVRLACAVCVCKMNRWVGKRASSALTTKWKCEANVFEMLASQSEGEELDPRRDSGVYQLLLLLLCCLCLIHLTLLLLMRLRRASRASISRQSSRSSSSIAHFSIQVVCTTCRPHRHYIIKRWTHGHIKEERPRWPAHWLACCFDDHNLRLHSPACTTTFSRLDRHEA